MFYKFLKKIYFYTLDKIIFFLNLNNKNNKFNNRKIVIWIAETGSRDFLPRLAQAISLWREYSIPSVVIHKHMLRKMDKKIFKSAVVVDKSATFNCIRRLRFSKMNGALNVVIPEELLIIDESESQIKGSLNQKTLNYVDYVLTNSKTINNYILNLNKDIKFINATNPRLSAYLIKKNCSPLLTNRISVSNSIEQDFILINDKLSLKFSSLEKELEIIKNSVFKSTDIDPNSFIENYMLEEEEDERLLIKLIVQLRKNEIFNKFKIIIRPHPSVDINKYTKYFIDKLEPSLNYSILRNGTALDWMNEAKFTFHNNCTTAIEGFSNGLENIFNYSSKLRLGTSENFKTILKPLGIEKSITNAKDLLKNELNRTYSLDKNKITENKFNFYRYLGNNIVKYDNNKIKKKFLTSNLKKAFINESSPLQRWEYALNKIRYIEENKEIFEKMNIYPIGNVGVQIGTLFY